MSRQNASGPSIEYSLGQALIQRGWKLGVAESCTGGMLGARLTSIPGSSLFFTGGVIVYSNRFKQELLGVSSALLEEAGAVSRLTALAMVDGLRRFQVDAGISITGVAGPGGGTTVNPVGSTWIGVFTPEQQGACHYQWQGTREDNRMYSAQAALELTLKMVLGEMIEDAC